MVSVGVLLRDGDAIANAPVTQTYLTPGAPAYFGDYYRLQIGKQIYRDMEHLLAGLTGDRSDLAHRGMSGWFADPKEAEEFSHSQHAGSMGPALMLATGLTSPPPGRCSMSPAGLVPTRSPLPTKPGTFRRHPGLSHRHRRCP